LRHVPLLAQFLALIERKGWVYELETAVGEELKSVVESVEEADGVKTEEEEDVKLVVRAGGVADRKALARDVVNSF
jgi:hypothetical protein